MMVSIFTGGFKNRTDIKSDKSSLKPVNLFLWGISNQQHQKTWLQSVNMYLELIDTTFYHLCFGFM